MNTKMRLHLVLKPQMEVRTKKCDLLDMNLETHKHSNLWKLKTLSACAMKFVNTQIQWQLIDVPLAFCNCEIICFRTLHYVHPNFLFFYFFESIVDGCSTLPKQVLNELLTP